MLLCAGATLVFEKDGFENTTAYVTLSEDGIVSLADNPDRACSRYSRGGCAHFL